MSNTHKALYEFGPFVLDSGDRMLLRDGQYVPLTPKAFETLHVLVQHHGRIVDKEELLKQVWPATFVEDVTLAKSVSLLRKVLGNDSEHRYIETVPKRGYRFSADVRVVAAPAGQEEPGITEAAFAPAPPATAAPAAGVITERPRSLRPAWIRVAVASAAIFTLAATLMSALRWRGSASAAAASAWKTVPVTSFPGTEDEPAFSPDGERIAFVRSGPNRDTPHIYIKTIRGDRFVQLTHDSGADAKPAWSPDGRFIAFQRTSGPNRAWFIAPVTGGQERKLADVFPYLDPGPGNSPYWSPNGKYLAIVDKKSTAEPSSIFLISRNGSERRQVTSPPAGTSGDFYPAFSPDGTKLAFARADSFSSTDLYVLPLSDAANVDAAPKRITFDAITIQGLAWTQDSRQIVFSSRRGGSINCLWRIGAAGGNPELVSTIGKDVISPAISPAGNRLAYTQTLDDMNIWSFRLNSAGRARQERQVVASTFKDSDPDFSPDGRRIAFASGRSGGFGIWISDSDGANPHLLFDGGAYVTGSPRWSPDGRSIAFDSRAKSGTAGEPHIYIAGVDGAAHRLTDDQGVAPSWSRDGRWIYFGSTRGGSRQIWKIPAAGGAPLQVTRYGGFEGYESEDGRYLYYLKDRATPGIWRMPATGGDEALVTDRDRAGLWRYWRVSGNRIYFATDNAPSGPALEFVELTTGRVREAARLQREPDMATPGLAVSADGQRILYAQDDQSGSDIVMVDGFR